jgi:hypothetical protein
LAISPIRLISPQHRHNSPPTSGRFPFAVPIWTKKSTLVDGLVFRDAWWLLPFSSDIIILGNFRDWFRVTFLLGLLVSHAAFGVVRRIVFRSLYGLHHSVFLLVKVSRAQDTRGFLFFHLPETYIRVPSSVDIHTSLAGGFLRFWHPNSFYSSIYSMCQYRRLVSASHAFPHHTTLLILVPEKSGLYKRS